MRIIIESAEQAGVATLSYEPTPPAHVETMNAGAPSETLMQTTAETLPESRAREAIDGGSPPEWLVEAIQGAAQFRTEGAGKDINAGSAPSSEG